ncbi:MAG: hypothetical protein ACLPX9_07345 [Rhodomicrobium sp.]
MPTFRTLEETAGAAMARASNAEAGAVPSAKAWAASAKPKHKDITVRMNSLSLTGNSSGAGRLPMD